MEGRRILTADFTKGTKTRRPGQNIVQAITAASAAGLGPQPDVQDPLYDPEPDDESSFDGPGQDTEVLANDPLAVAEAIEKEERVEGEVSLFVLDQLGSGESQRHG